jgi:hypothetical protein
MPVAQARMSHRFSQNENQTSFSLPLLTDAAAFFILVQLFFNLEKFLSSHFIQQNKVKEEEEVWRWTRGIMRWR